MISPSNFSTHPDDESEKSPRTRQGDFSSLTPPHSNPTTPTKPKNEQLREILLEEIETLNLKIDNLTFELSANEKNYRAQIRKINNERKSLKQELEQWQTKFEDRVNDFASAPPPKTSKDMGRVVLLERIDELENDLCQSQSTIGPLEKRLERAQNQNQILLKQIEMLPLLMESNKELQQNIEESEKLIVGMQNELDHLNSRLRETEIVELNDLAMVNIESAVLDTHDRTLLNSQTLFDELENNLDARGFAKELARKKTWGISWSVLWAHYLFHLGLSVCRALKEGPNEVVRRVAGKKLSGNRDF
ncbi:hypothetical protein NEOLI_003662 [Neolecta irregularis DAH-3]|uniref:Uncharacterized protein n=1 Tax=Neolecta irregularis (strain DAH-3) TaxID=1198029 RepID=A0A1U7LS61_NEOID|nr:hypothetical protein NEOLI_003662 [Neolecta irregularis DAH-3]|eukprot:OLL25510.1 hypothetical protein NEOLI_003662 [Neolecta irregularis DAH-3]